MPRKKSTPPAKQLSDAALELIATRFRALSEPMRLRLLNLLMKDEQTDGCYSSLTVVSGIFLIEQLAQDDKTTIWPGISGGVAPHWQLAAVT